jgi:adenosine deaminase
VPAAAALVLDPTTELTDLHIHVGGAVAPHILWAIAHDSGFKLPVKSYWDFCDLVYADPAKVSSLGDYLDIMHQWTERIQSSPAAIERSIYEVIGKEYRSSRVSTIELRFNPMKRNVGGERDLDYIIAAALRGMDRACLDYGVKAGLIFCLAREFEYEPNEILVRKAEKYRGHGVIGIDLAGPEQHTLELGGDVDRYRDLFARARQAGLGTTVHTGETTHTGPEGVLAVIEKLKPARIGHGIAAAQSDEAMRKLVENGIVLELCPSSNLRTHAVADVADLRRVFDRLRAAGVRMTINTDGTYLLGTTLRKEFDLLLGEQIVSQSEATTYIANARNASFLPR